VTAKKGKTLQITLTIASHHCQHSVVELPLSHRLRMIGKVQMLMQPFVHGICDNYATPFSLNFSPSHLDVKHRELG
jgi:hypothetical protein